MTKPRKTFRKPDDPKAIAYAEHWARLVAMPRELTDDAARDQAIFYCDQVLSVPPVPAQRKKITAVFLRVARDASRRWWRLAADAWEKAGDSQRAADCRAKAGMT